MSAQADQRESGALKPCPFCGSPAMHNIRYGAPVVDCTECDAESSEKDWNARAPLSPPTDAEVETAWRAYHFEPHQVCNITPSEDEKVAMRAALSAFLDERNRA